MLPVVSLATITNGSRPARAAASVAPPSRHLSILGSSNTILQLGLSVIVALVVVVVVVLIFFLEIFLSFSRLRQEFHLFYALSFLAFVC